MTLATTGQLGRRQSCVRARLAGLRADALVVTHLPNVFYLTGFQGSAGVVVLTGDRLHLVTDGRYVTEAEAALKTGRGSRDAAVVRVEGSYDETVARLLELTGCERIAVEGESLPASRFLWLARRLGLTGVPVAAGTAPDEAGSEAGCVLLAAEGLVAAERIIKDAVELGTIQEAAERLSAVLEAVVDEVRAGRRERDIAALVDLRVKEAGFSRAAFDTIVASGPNGALPHARPGDRVLEPGDLVVLDFGGVYDGYCVDLSRTISLGSPGLEARRVHRAVSEALAAGVAAVQPGVKASAVDAATRSVLEGYGLGDAFTHATGHGLGIEVHEAPRIGPARVGRGGDDVLAEGMVFTMEPGVYRSGWGGIRIEDDVVVTAVGCRVLTPAPRGLLER